MPTSVETKNFALSHSNVSIDSLTYQKETTKQRIGVETTTEKTGFRSANLDRLACSAQKIGLTLIGAATSAGATHALVALNARQICRSSCAEWNYVEACMIQCHDSLHLKKSCLGSVSGVVVGLGGLLVAGSTLFLAKRDAYSKNKSALFTV